MDKPSLPSGTRDFGPEVMMRRKFIIGIIEETFKRFGFLPLETPAVENLKTLQGKYGDEGDQLLFKILNNGDFLAKADENLLHQRDSKSLTSQISDRGLRYDLTVPLARFVVMNRDKIHFPFKRYQIQTVWRADRPQKGRYREFWQCDADILGSQSISNEADLLQIYDNAFATLGLKVNIRFNHRGILDAFEPWLEGATNHDRFMQLIDKADKIGFEGVLNEITNEAIPNGAEAWTLLHNINNLSSNEEKLTALQNASNIQHEALLKGISEIKHLLSLLNNLPASNTMTLDVTLARGLSYYTGMVMEVVPADDRIPEDFRIGSIGGGGRYDNLTGVFGLKDVTGVGISFGLDRIYDLMDAAAIFPTESMQSTVVLFCCMDENALSSAFGMAKNLRDAGISTEVYPGAVKLKKQLDYANNKSIQWACILGEQEIADGTVSVKNLISGEQKTCPQNQILQQISQ
ncbi:MAG: histidine--tRNA ligase [Sphingomonadales bacterium]|nr:histidine--tRNA ligase [Sphingomonadales bacterium]